MVRAVAITGGIGAGKSQVRMVLEKIGYVCCSADVFAREILLDNKVTTLIRAQFGDDVFHADGSLHREQLRNIVFSNNEQREKLEAITHPAIADLFQKKLRELNALCPTAWLFYEAPVILEAGRQKDFDAIVLVVADEDTRIARLESSRGLDKVTAKKIIDSQMHDDEKRKHCHFIIDNSGDFSTLEQNVKAMLTHLQHRFAY